MSTSTNKPLLLLGADGMLGRAFAEALTREHRPFRSMSPPEFDLRDESSIARAVSIPPGAVINCCAFTDVDGAEQDESAATAVNATGVGMLARACRSAHVPLLHFSTDYVFDGSGQNPYPPIDPPEHCSPVNAYGRSKLAGERLIGASGCEHLIVRTSWLYAPWARNFVRTIAAAAQTRPEIRVVHDQRGRPTCARALAAASLELLDRGRRGIWHVTDAGECSWFEFASEIVHLTGAPCKVSPCATADFPRPARRPAFSVLDISATEAVLGPQADWRERLAATIQELAGAGPA